MTSDTMAVSGRWDEAGSYQILRSMCSSFGGPDISSLGNY